MNDGKKRRKKSKKVSRIITIILILVIFIFFGILFYINIIPTIYILIALIISILIIIGLFLLNFSHKRGVRWIGYFLSTLTISIIIFVLVYLFNTLGFLINATDGDYALKTYNVLVLKESNYKKIEDLNKHNIGISETILDDTLNKIKDNINKKIKINYKEYEDTNTLVNKLINEDIESIILENSEIDLLKEEDYEKYELLNNIYQIEVKNDIKTLKDAVNINKETFNIYISGIDTFGKINSSSRSDVNMVLTVNPKSEKILITWIPRDYYVYINDSNYKDKLTHAGIYGIDSSIYAIEKLLDIDINYYVKVNFTSVIKVVDLLGGITVYNDETFTSIDGYTYKKGNVTLNGEKALSFVRERKNVTGGDLGRGKNQIKVIEALMKKAMSPNIIKTYNSLLKSLDGAFVTNMSHTTMLGFIKKEIQSPRDWQIDSYTLSGKDSYDYTYTYKNNKLYVMIPDEEVVNESKNKLKEILDK